jgi:hypothetical protein
MEELDKLIEVLEASVKKNGKDTTLTVGHLLNICEMVRGEVEREDFESDMAGAYIDSF